MSQISTFEQRQADAEKHSLAMIEKYKEDDFVKRESGLNYTLWYGNYKNGSYDRHYPMPYCRRYYFSYFMSKVFINSLRQEASIGLFPPLIADVASYLDEAFSKADATDLHYIKGLLVQAEELEILDGDKVIFATGRGLFGRVDLASVTRVERNSAEYYYSFAGYLGNKLLSPFEVYQGGDHQKRRVGFVREWLENKSKGGHTISANEVACPKEKGANDFNQRQIALQYAYERWEIAKKNDIATRYGWSAESLYNQYINVQVPNNRLGVPNKKRMLKDIEAILPMLSKQATSQANKDIERLKEYIATGSDQ